MLLAACCLCWVLLCLFRQLATCHWEEEEEGVDTGLQEEQVIAVHNSLFLECTFLVHPYSWWWRRMRLNTHTLASKPNASCVCVVSCTVMLVWRLLYCLSAVLMKITSQSLQLVGRCLIADWLTLLFIYNSSKLYIVYYFKLTCWNKSCIMVMPPWISFSSIIFATIWPKIRINNNYKWNQ